MSIVEAERPSSSYHAPQRFRLRGIDWSTYRTISTALNGRHVRLTYDRGTLEFMTISPRRAKWSRLLGRFVVVLTEEFGLPVSSLGDMTCDREELERGIEPDECFYIASEPAIRDKEEIDLSVDPPPDLGIEIDVTRDSRTRLPIYAALSIPEVWRYDGQSLTIHLLSANGEYEPVPTGRSFPSVPGERIAEFLAQANQCEENALVASFRAWARQLRGS